jgi:hypothetical protein
MMQAMFHRSIFARLRAFVALLALVVTGAQAQTFAPPDPAAQAFALEFAASVMRHADAGGRAFGIVDKQAATLWVFDSGGQLVASTPVLVGLARGDVAPADIGLRPLSKVRANEKITAAGRYPTEPGRNQNGEDIVWLDYDSAMSMHRARNVAGEARAQRLLSPSVADNRITYGCINVPAGFYNRYVDQMFSRSTGIVYVLPESTPLASVFPFAADVSAPHK